MLRRENGTEHSAPRKRYDVRFVLQRKVTGWRGRDLFDPERSDKPLRENICFHRRKLTLRPVWAAVRFGEPRYQGPMFRTNCIEKAELAKRFLGFLAEIDFFHGAVTENPELARKELIKYQESKNFSHTGWYGRDVFKWIVIDYYQKT